MKLAGAKAIGALRRSRRQTGSKPPAATSSIKPLRPRSHGLCAPGRPARGFLRREPRSRQRRATAWAASLPCTASDCVTAIRAACREIAHLLKNRFYIGEVVYRGHVHRGEHVAILDRALFRMITSSVVSMTLFCSSRAHSRTEDEKSVSKVARNSDELIQYGLSRPRALGVTMRSPQAIRSHAHADVMLAF